MCKVFHYKYNTSGHNFTGHYYVQVFYRLFIYVLLLEIQLSSVFVNYKKGALVSQSQVIKFTSCLPKVDGFLRVLRLPPPLKLVAMI